MDEKLGNVARTVAQFAPGAPGSTKARILATAEKVFAEKGFEGASTREIAARAGVNISSLHYHWDSKETLYLAVFQSIYERIVQLVRAVGRPGPETGASVEAIVETAMGRLFDFFYDHPTIPKLLVRRLLEEHGPQVAIEAEVLAPAWKVFASWTRHFRRRPMTDSESMLFMLTVHSMMLLFQLDSREFTKLLGGSIRDPEVRDRVRSHIISVVQRLLQSE